MSDEFLTIAPGRRVLVGTGIEIVPIEPTGTLDSWYRVRRDGINLGLGATLKEAERIALGLALDMRLMRLIPPAPDDLDDYHAYLLGKLDGQER